MRHCIKHLCVLLGLAMSTTYIQAQTKTYVEGSVKDEKGKSLTGATIQEKDRASNVTMSDSTGHYSLELKGKSNQIVISYVGFEDQTLKVTGSKLNVVLNLAQGNTSEVVVIGYQSQKRRNLTGSVASISGKDIQNIPEASFDQMLQGRIAGMNVQSPTGSPGAKPNIIIRGSTNIDYGNMNGGNTGPLYVIDGVIFDVNNMATSTNSAASNPLSLINPNDIESIDVLKDASAAAIYGARGGNGVIIVKTKRAQRTSKPQINVNAYMGVASKPNLRKVITGTLERRLKQEMLNSQLPYSDIQNGMIPQGLSDSLNPAFNNDVDWQGMMLRNTAISNNEDISMAGYFSGNNSYRLAFNHYSEQGAVKGFSLERVAPNLNFNLNPIRHFNINANLLLNFETRKMGAGIDYYNPYIFNNYNFPSSFAQLSDETKAIYDGSSSKFNDNKIFTLNANVQATDTIINGLTLTTSFGINNYNDKHAYFVPKELNGVQNTAYDYERSNPNWNWETYAQYVKAFKDHHFVLVGGYSAYKAQQYGTDAYAAGINVSGIYTLQTVPPGANLYVSSYKQVKTTESYYGRLSYDYKGRYLLAGSIRRDASSIYSPQNRWGTFSSVSAGWIVSDEDFFQPIKSTVNFLKFRASYGVTGIDPGAWYGKYQPLYADASFLGATTGVIGGNVYYSYPSGTPSTYNGTTVLTPYPYNNNFINSGVKSSSSVKWERYPQVDLGMDLTMFNSRLNVTVDWYQKDAVDKYLWTVPADGTTGYMYFSGNLAGIRNQGLEVAVSSQNFAPSSAFQWNTDFNIAFNKNWIIKLPNDNRDMLFGDPWFRKTLTLGSPLFSYKLWQANGVYATDADVPTDPITGQKMSYFDGPLRAGDANITDQNGDYNINYEDQFADGSSPLPKFTGGLTNTFSYKGISLRVFASYSFGNKILNGSLSDNLNSSSAYASWGAMAGPAAFGDRLSQFWQQPGDQTTYPRLIYPSGVPVPDPWNISRSYFLEPGGFIKLKQLMLSYNIHGAFTRKIGISGFNVYAMGENLWMWKQSKDIADPELYDPTTGSVNIIYPTVKKYTLGLQVRF